VYNPEAEASDAEVRVDRVVFDDARRTSPDILREASILVTSGKCKPRAGLSSPAKHRRRVAARLDNSRRR
jgi:hypothetical protein